MPNKQQSLDLTHEFMNLQQQMLQLQSQMLAQLSRIRLSTARMALDLNTLTHDLTRRESTDHLNLQKTLNRQVWEGMSPGRVVPVPSTQERTTVLKPPEHEQDSHRLRLPISQDLAKKLLARVDLSRLQASLSASLVEELGQFTRFAFGVDEHKGS
jgi:hypothetical protein